MFDVPAIVVRFNRRKIDSSAYGHACWKHFWVAVNPKELFAVNLFEGDSPGTLYGTEDVYCLGFQTLIPQMLDAIRTGLNSNPEITALLATPKFVEGPAAVALLFNVLPESGMINGGQVEGGPEARNPRSALPSAAGGTRTGYVPQNPLPSPKVFTPASAAAFQISGVLVFLTDLSRQGRFKKNAGASVTVIPPHGLFPSADAEHELGGKLVEYVEKNGWEARYEEFGNGDQWRAFVASLFPGSQIKYKYAKTEATGYNVAIILSESSRNGFASPFTPAPLDLSPFKIQEPAVLKRRQPSRPPTPRAPSRLSNIGRKLWGIWTGGESDKAWGIEVGQSSLKALCCERSENGGISPLAFDFIEYSHTNGEPTSQVVQDAITAFASRHDTKHMQVAISVPGQVGVARYVKLTPAEDENVYTLLEQEAKKQVKFPWEEAQWDYQYLPSGEGEFESRFVVSVAQRQAIDTAVQQLRAANVRVSVVQSSPLAIHNLLARDLVESRQLTNQNPEKSVSSLTAVSIGADTTDLVITDGTWYWHRSIPVGGNHFTRQLCKEFTLTFSDADRLKRSPGDAENVKKRYQAYRPVFSDLITELQRSISYFSSIYRGTKVDQVMFLGNPVKLPGLTRYITTHLGIEVMESPSLQNLAQAPILQSATLQENIATFGVCYGLSLQALYRAALSTNLLPGRRAGATKRLIN